VDQVAVVLPGAGSSADFVRRAFGRPLREAGYGLVVPDPVPGPDLVAAAFRALDEAVAEYGPRLRLVGGVSLGAHTVARWAAGRATSAAPGSAPASPAPPARRVELDGVVLVLPAWTGAPGAVAAATAASADLVERLGTAGALAAAGTAVGWVAAELAAAWPAYGSGLAASLRAAAAAPGPTPAELAALRVPAGLVAFADDPLHPAAVAHEWAAAIPRAAVRELPLAAPAGGRSVLATTALAALAAARAR
jgi:pimeloyl-ACP methyl ester carboxylesterase